MLSRKEKIRANGGSHTEQEWESLKRWYNNRCAKCGANNPTKDHIIPVNKGGTDNISNIQPLCQQCNSSKLDRFATDYRDSFFRRFPEEYRRLTQTTSYFTGQIRRLLFFREIIPGSKSHADFNYLMDVLWSWGIDGELRDLAIKEFTEWLDL
jgi:hypothetical protein